jgi:hypothetical protein
MVSEGISLKGIAFLVYMVQIRSDKSQQKSIIGDIKEAAKGV